MCHKFNMFVCSSISQPGGVPQALHMPMHAMAVLFLGRSLILLCESGLCSIQSLVSSPACTSPSSCTSLHLYLMAQCS